jgi:two-component sensor histidine kinase
MKLNFEKILYHVNDAVYVLDKEWRFTFANKAALRYSPKRGLLGKNIWDEFPQLKNTQVEECYRKAMKTGKNIKFDFQGLITKRYLQVSVYPSRQGLLVYTVEITDKKIMEDNLKKAVSEKELLIKEAHHRIKNNLQIISSLLNFQIKKIKDKELKNIFTDTQNRITAISIIHKSLYHSSSLSFVNVKSFMDEFIDNLTKSLLPKDKSISISINIDEVTVNSDIGMAVSLIINELVTNSIKYAFKHKKKGNIAVRLRKVDDRLELIVKDNGIGLPENVDLKKPEGIGFRVINGLASQNNGKFKYKFNKGGEFKVKFSNVPDLYKVK